MKEKRTLALGLALLCLSIAISGSAASAREHTLYSIERSRQDGSTYLRFTLSQVPEHHVETSGQRVDITFSDTEVANTFQELEAGGEVIRTMLAEKGSESIVSLVLRRPPRDVEYSTAEQERVLRVRIAWPQDETRSRPAIASELDGRLTLGRKGVSLSRRISSPYEDSWLDFFREYEFPLELEPDLAYTLPPFQEVAGLLGGEDGLLPREVLTAGGEGEWAGALSALEKSGEGEISPRRRQLRRVAAAYLLLRQGEIRQAKQELLRMDQVKDSSGSRILAYLRSYSAAAGGDPYLGYVRARELDTSREAPRRWRSYARLLQIETALGAGRNQRAYSLASDPPGEGFPDKEVFELRRAQAAFAVGKKERAVREWEHFSRKLLQSHPRALAELAGYRYDSGDYGRALQLFSRLARGLTAADQVAMARFAEAMCDLHRGARMMARNGFKSIVEEYGEIRAKWRAEMKLTDMKVLDEGSPDPSALAASYRDISRRADSRRIREEASFKRTLLPRIFGYPHQSVQWLGPFLRQYSAGELRIHAQALLAEILPGVVKDLMDQEAYIRAMALVQRHQETLRQARLPLDFLLELGGSFSRFGFTDRAVRVYECMMSLTGSRKERENIYPLLGGAYMRQENYSLAETLAARYLENYPQGDHRKRMFYQRAKSLQEEGRSDNATELLQSPQRPVSRDLDSLTGRILFSQGRYKEAQFYLSRATCAAWQSSDRELLLLRAECLFRIGGLEQARTLYSFLEQEGYRKDQASYRLGQIHMLEGQAAQGTKLWRQIVEEKDSPLWAALAGEGLAMNALQKRIKD